MKVILYILLLLNLSLNAQGLLTRKATVLKFRRESATPDIIKKNILILIGGESNAGGLGLNYLADDIEVAVSTDVKMWHNYKHFFDSIRFNPPDQNAILGHIAWSNNGTQHGFELELGNLVRNLTLQEYNVYVVKTGQGGTTTSTWVNNSYFSAAIWDTMKTRYFDAYEYMMTLPEELEVVAFMTLGMNNAYADSDPSLFESQFVQFYDSIHNILGIDKIITTQIPHNDASYEAIDSVIVKVANDSSWLWSVGIDGANMVDAAHWSYWGLQQICDTMINKYFLIR